MNINQKITRADLPNLSGMLGNPQNSWNNPLPNDLFIKGVPKNIHKKFATADNVGNVGVGVDSLHSFSLPANSLRADGDSLDIDYSGFFANNANTKRIVLNFDGSAYLDTGARDVVESAINLRWRAIIKCIRLSATSVKLSSFLFAQFIGITSAGVIVNLGGGYNLTQGRAALTVANLNSNAVTLLVQAEGTANDDIVQDLSWLGLTRF